MGSSGASLRRVSYRVDLARMEREILGAADSSRARPGYVGLLGYSVFGYLEGWETRPVRLVVEAPPDWPVFTTLAPAAPPPRGRAAADAADFTFDYALWDDDVNSLSIWSQPDDSLARTILRDAYIEVDTVPAVSAPFDQNLSEADVAALPTAPTSSPEYWTAPLVLAFEGNEQGKDGDPSLEEYIYGLANGPEGGQTSRWPRVAIYAETIRDYRDTPPANAPASRVSRDEIMTNATAHEILHMFGLIHDGNRTQGSIMCASLFVDGNETNRAKVTPDQLKLIREATEMKIRRVPVNCP